jgi:hypothetical protein
MLGVTVKSLVTRDLCTCSVGKGNFGFLSKPGCRRSDCIIGIFKCVYMLGSELGWNSQGNGRLLWISYNFVAPLNEEIS